MNIILQVASAFLGYVLGLLTSSYLSKKGQNLADKEDIKEITKKIESVKSSFKADLMLLDYNQQKKYEIFMDFFEACLEFKAEAELSLDVVHGKFYRDEIENHGRNMKNLWQNFIKGYLKLQIFIKNGSTLQSSVRKLAVNCSQFYLAHEKNWGEVFGAYLNPQESVSFHERKETLYYKGELGKPYKSFVECLSGFSGELSKELKLQEEMLSFSIKSIKK